MKIYPDNVDKPLEPLITSGEGRKITVFLTPMPSGGKRNFRCPNCGKIVFQYESDIGLIVDSSEVPNQSAPVDAMCHRCHLMVKIIW